MGLYDEIFIEHLLYQALSQLSWDYKQHMKHEHSPQGASSLIRETELKQGMAEEISLHSVSQHKLEVA